MADIQSATAEIRRGKKMEEETTREKNILYIDFLSGVVQKWPNRSICHLGHKLHLSRKKRKFNSILEVVPPCTISIIFARWRRYTQRHSTMSCAQKGWTDWFAVWVVDSGGSKKAQAQSYSPGGDNVPIWCHLANMIEPSICGDDAVLSNYFDHLFYLSQSVLQLLQTVNRMITRSNVTCHAHNSKYTAVLKFNRHTKILQ